MAFGRLAEAFHIPAVDNRGIGEVDPATEADPQKFRRFLQQSQTSGTPSFDRDGRLQTGLAEDGGPVGKAALGESRNASATAFSAFAGEEPHNSGDSIGPCPDEFPKNLDDQIQELGQRRQNNPDDLQ